MKRLLRLIILVGLSSAAAVSQVQDITPPKTDLGEIANGTYSNECLGLSFRLPEKWEFISGSARAARLSPTTLMLFRAGHTFDDGAHGTFGMIAEDAGKTAPPVDRYLSGVVANIATAHANDYQTIRDVYPVSFAGRKFYRMDFRSGLQYRGIASTLFRGFVLSASFEAPSQEKLDDEVNALKWLKFREDERNPQCMLSDAPPEGVVGTIGGVSGGKVDQAVLDKLAKGMMDSAIAGPIVRVSESVSQAFLVDRVEPKYPPSARAAKIEGDVVVRLIVDTDGKILRVTALSGPNELRSAAFDAAMKWHYKPYLLNGKPIKVDTQATIHFKYPGD